VNLKVVSLVILAFVGTVSLVTETRYSGRDDVAAPPRLATKTRPSGHDWIMGGQPGERGAVAPPAGTKRKEPKSELERRLSAITGASFVEQRKIVFEARENLGFLEEPLGDVLRDQNYHLLREAIWLAGELRLQSCLQQLRGLARTAYEVDVRLAAFRAAELIEPWSIESLFRFLTDDDARVAQTVLGIVKSRQDSSLGFLLDLIRKADDDVRQAVARRLPELLDPNQIAQLTTGGATSNTMQGILLGKVRNGNPAEQLAALEALAHNGAPLVDTAAIYALLGDRRTPQATKRAALIALERTRTVDADKVARLLPQMDATLRFYAARCLVTAGDNYGLHVLAQLARIRPSTHRSIHEAAIELLSLLSGHQYDEAWMRQWTMSKPKLANVKLPAPKLLD